MTKNIARVFLALLVTYASPCVAQVTSVSNSDGTLTISPTTGAVIGSLNLGNANTWTATQTMGDLSVTGTTIDLDVYGAIYEDGSENVAFGEYTFLNAFVTNDTAIGSQTLTNTTGNKNTAVGDWAQHESTSGSYNTSLGFDALYGNTSSSDNTGIGDSALGAANLGNNNTAVGQAALYLSYGANNTAIGAGALYSETSGTNDALGEYAAYYITTGTSNVALGQYAMQGISATPLTGNSNTGVGNSALYTLQGGATDNTTLGSEAGYSLTSGTDNTLVGYESGYGVTGSHNIILGEDPSSAITTGSSNILIGNSLTKVTDSASNQIDIGDVITVTGSGTPSTSNTTIQGSLTIDGSCTGCAGGGVFSAGQLQRGGSTTLSYCPYKGNMKTTASQGIYTIPSGCLTATITSMYKGGTASQSLSAGTLYYIYLWDNSGTWVLDAETTGHTTNTTNGVEQMSGDSTKTLVGMVYPQSGPVLTDSTSARLVATWDNRTPKGAYAKFSTVRTTTSTTSVEINSEIEIPFLSWGDTVQINYGGGYIRSASSYASQYLGIGGCSTSDLAAVTITWSANNSSASLAGVWIPSEGETYATVCGLSGSASSIAYYDPTTATGTTGLTVMPII
jgi:hypothetical protein